MKPHRNKLGFYVATEKMERKPEGRPDLGLKGLTSIEKLCLRDIKWRMCSLGPKHCAACESSCAYGREYLKRTEGEKGNGKT